MDRLGSLERCASATFCTNPDLSSTIGQRCGSLLGLKAIRSSFEYLSDRCGTVDIDAIFHEVSEAEERIGYACDKYLRRFDPPLAGIFGNSSYALFAAGMLEKYLDADIAFIGARNDAGPSPYPTEVVKDLGRVEELLEEHTPDLILGSTYEHSLRPGITFIGLIPPLRNRLLLHAHPL
ncbi:MAG TPA: oxidoreductase, partial [Methanomicrobiales archaeon]|nr:oxidoreductase [Methanomicrobiales archaeon]